jgi:hypothetical protein
MTHARRLCLYQTRDACYVPSSVNPNHRRKTVMVSASCSTGTAVTQRKFLLLYHFLTSSSCSKVYSTFSCSSRNFRDTSLSHVLQQPVYAHTCATGKQTSETKN